MSRLGLGLGLGDVSRALSARARVLMRRRDSSIMVFSSNGPGALQTDHRLVVVLKVDSDPGYCPGDNIATSVNKVAIYSDKKILVARQYHACLKRSCSAVNTKPGDCVQSISLIEWSNRSTNKIISLYHLDIPKI